MAALADKMRTTASKKVDNAIILQTEKSDITSNFAENNNRSKTSEKLDDIAASENKQPKPDVNKESGVEEELQGKNIPNQQYDEGKNFRTFLKTSVVLKKLRCSEQKA